MRINNVVKLQTKLDREYSWRRRECSSLKLDLKREIERHEEVLRYKAAITLLYAHWETLVKKSAIYYLDYLTSKGLKFSELNPCFLYFHIPKKCSDISKTNLRNFSVFKRVYESMNVSNNELFDSFNADLISTRDSQNMKSSEFKNIIDKIGLNYKPEFSLKDNLIDEVFLNERNKIAHEGVITSDRTKLKESFENIHDSIWVILDTIKDDLVAAAECKTYLKVN